MIKLFLKILGIMVVIVVSWFVLNDITVKPFLQIIAVIVCLVASILCTESWGLMKKSFSERCSFGAAMVAASMYFWLYTV